MNVNGYLTMVGIESDADWLAEQAVARRYAARLRVMAHAARESAQIPHKCAFLAFFTIFTIGGG